MGRVSASRHDACGSNARGQGDSRSRFPWKESRHPRMASKAKRTIATASFSADTLEFIRLLAKHSVRYVIVGGQAVIFHGYARFTGDVDFFIRTTERTPNAFSRYCWNFGRTTFREFRPLVSLKSRKRSFNSDDRRIV